VSQLVRVDIIDIQLGIRRHTLQQKRDQARIVRRRQARIDCGKGVGVGGTQIGWNQHASDDEGCLRMFRSYSGQNGLKILACGCEGHAAQTVISTEFEHEDVDFLVRRQNPVNSTSTGSRGLTTESGIHHICLPAE